MPHWTASDLERLANAAASMVRERSGATVGIALAGTAGADEGIYGRNSGETWLAVAAGHGVTTLRIPYGGQDEFTFVRIGNQALRKLWELAEGETPVG